MDVARSSVGSFPTHTRKYLGSGVGIVCTTYCGYFEDNEPRRRSALRRSLKAPTCAVKRPAAAGNESPVAAGTGSGAFAGALETLVFVRMAASSADAWSSTLGGSGSDAGAGSACCGAEAATTTGAAAAGARGSTLGCVARFDAYIVVFGTLMTLTCTIA